MSKEVRYAALLGGGYAIAAGLYIVVSSHAASVASVDVAALADIETLKGMVFVVVTGILLSCGTLVLLRRVARHRNELAAAHDALIHADRKAAAGMLAATVAHDLNNVLTIVNMGLEALRELDSASEREEVLADMEGATRKAAELSTRLANAARDSATGSAVSSDLAASAREALDLVALHRAVRECSVDLEARGVVRRQAFPLLVQQMVSNLVINAAEACGRGGRIVVRVHATEDGGAVVEVDDDGPGIAPEQRGRVFEPFHTTKPDGTGLGLLSVRLCAQLHGARAEIVDSSLGGARFRVVFEPPAEAASAMDALRTQAEVAPAPGPLPPV